MSLVKVMIHSVWGTKNREPLIHPTIKDRLLEHICYNAKKKKIFIDTINSQPDHIHCLFALNASMSVSTTLNLIKGEASHWVNNQKLIKRKLEWADEYFAASVSESQMSKVRDYILNQDEHHRKITFTKEFDNFLKAYGLKRGRAKAPSSGSVDSTRSLKAGVMTGLKPFKAEADFSSRRTHGKAVARDKNCVIRFVRV